MRLIRSIVGTVMAAALMLTAAAPASAAPLVVPVPPREGLAVPHAPGVSAQTWILYDAGAGTVLSSSDADEERAMASTTKIMTALVALKYGDLDESVTVSPRAAGVGESEIGLVAGEEIGLETLVRALVVRSANDAAMAVAEHVAGSVEAFVGLMNQEAERMGLTHTHFANPHGLDASDHYSSARDLLKIGLAAMDYPEFRDMAATTDAPFPPAPDGTKRPIETTNHLLEDYPGAIGVKTGFTSDAQLVLVAAAERESRTLFAVVMGSEGSGGHFADAETLLDWGFQRFEAVSMVSGDSYRPQKPTRLVEADPDPEPEVEEEPVITRFVRSTDGEPPELVSAFGWFGRMLEGWTGD